MKKIVYKFNDGTKSVVEVTDEFYDYYMNLEHIERNKQQTETRRHVSLEYLHEHGIDVESNDSDPLESIIENLIKEEQKEELIKLSKAIKSLLPEQKRLVFKLFFFQESQVEIAREMGVSAVAIYNRKTKILSKLRKIMQQRS